MKYRIFLIALFCFGNSVLILSQTASVNQGCFPLFVQFESPNNPIGYFWSFKDGTSSSLQNPEHIFTQPGNYLVELFDLEGGNKIGEVEIVVYEEPQISFEADNFSGCTPFVVNFTSTITLDPAIEVESVLWSFGDGGRSSETNPSYTYFNPGIMSVSLEVNTNFLDCNKTILVTEYINVEGPDASFGLEYDFECEAPQTIGISPNVAFVNGNSYFWDFGNGLTSDEHDPGTITFNEEGVYIITQTVSSAEPCVSVFSDTILIGEPLLNFDLLARACLFESFWLNHNIFAEVIEWTFPQDAELLNEETLGVSNVPFLRFDTPGTKAIGLRMYSDLNCVSDTTIFIEIEQVDALFTFEPDRSCEDPVTIIATAINQTYENYNWGLGEWEGQEYVHSFIHDDPDRDSFYLHGMDLIPLVLVVESDIGCRDTVNRDFIQEIPDAIFIPSEISGCAPLTVEFFDRSRSRETIATWHYTLGNGDELNYINSLNHEYTFELPGDYCVKLDIENEVGCRDTSVCTWIRVRESSDIVLPGIDLDLCIGEDIVINAPFGSADAETWQLELEGISFSHCWLDDRIEYTINVDPGEYEVNYIAQNQECSFTFGEAELLVVKGARAEIGYNIECEEPLKVKFRNIGLGATRVFWDFAGLGSSTEFEPEYIFPAPGDYEVVLFAEAEGSGCDPQIDTVTIHVREIEAAFSFPEIICDEQAVFFDASTSSGVDNDCHKGYQWYFPNYRPRSTMNDEIQHLLPGGCNLVSLVVTDTNGCTDTLSQNVGVYNSTANFTSIPERLCNGAIVSFEDLSTTDTTIVDWYWTYGEDDVFFSSDQNPVDTFLNSDFENDIERIPIKLTITNAVGCISESVRFFTVYEILSEIVEAPEGVCTGSEFNLSALDFTALGSFLHFSWDMGNGDKIEGNNASYIYSEPGNYEVILTYTEDISGCFGMDTVNILVETLPLPDFNTNVDTISPLCYPQIIEFFNLSDTSDLLEYLWEFGEGSTSTLKDPVFSFGKGTYEVTLTNSFFGCESSTTQSFTLVGPEGEIIADDTEICKGDSITFSLVNTVDVSSWVWDFGDGVTESENETTVTHTYDDNPEGGETFASVILSSEDTGCEVTEQLNINIAEVFAGFESEVVGYCNGLARFTNTSFGAATYNWDFGDGNSSSEENPLHTYSNIGTYSVSLTISDADNICTDIFSQELIITEQDGDGYFFPNVFSPNNDGRNDFFNIVLKEENKEFFRVTTFKVFDRWGELIYNNENPSRGWDGRYDNKLAPAEVYAYYIEVEADGCGSIAKKGNVALLR